MTTNEKASRWEKWENWYMRYVRLIEACGADPTEVEFDFPDGHKAKVVKLENGSFGWQVRPADNDKEINQ